MIRIPVATSRSTPTREGAGVHLRRAFGFTAPERHDPFLLFDDFRSDSPADYRAGFPWHPHRGIETITYLLRGEVEHGDSLGNSGTISAGDVQWMTAGSGIIHQEMPRGDSTGAMHGFQLWMNLPAAEKMTRPRYRDVRAASIPWLEHGNGTRIGVICGRVGEVCGPVTGISTDPSYLDIILPTGAELGLPTPPGHTVLAYVIAGSAGFTPGQTERFPDTTLVRFGGGDKIVIEAGAAGARLLLLCGRPLGEPIAWRGPIVMNTEEQLRQAFAEYQAGTFLK